MMVLCRVIRVFDIEAIFWSLFFLWYFYCIRGEKAANRRKCLLKWIFLIGIVRWWNRMMCPQGKNEECAETIKNGLNSNTKIF